MSREILKLENIEKYYSGNIDKLHIIRNLSLQWKRENLSRYLEDQDQGSPLF